MIRVPREMKSFDGIGWGQTAQVKVPGGPMYHELQLNTNATAADIPLVELYVNGDPRVSITGAQMVMLENYQKHYVEAGKFIVPLACLFGRSLEGQALSGLNTSPSDNLIIKVHFGAGAGELSLSGVAWVSETPANSPIARYVPRIVSLGYAAGQSGRNINDTLRDGLARGAMVRRIHFDGRGTGAQDLITELRIRRDRRVEYEQTNADNRYQLKRRGLAPQDGFYHFDPVQSGFIRSEMFSLAGETLAFEVTTTAAGNFPVLIEAVEPQAA